MKHFIRAAFAAVTLTVLLASGSNAQVPLDSGNSAVQQLQSGWSVGNPNPPSLFGSGLNYAMTNAGGYISVSDPSLPSGEGILIDCGVCNTLLLQYYFDVMEAEWAVSAAEATAAALLEEWESTRSSEDFYEWENAYRSAKYARRRLSVLQDDLALLRLLLDASGC